MSHLLLNSNPTNRRSKYKKYKTTKLLGKKKKPIEDIHDLGIGNEFSDMPPKAQFIKGETDKQNFIKIKNACSAKDVVKRMKRQAADCEKTLANRTSDRGLVSRMYKEH